MSWDELSEALQHLANPVYLYIGGTALVLAFFLVLLLRRQPRSVVAYSNSGGKVMVSRSAILELVQTTCSQLDEVHKPSVKITTRGSTSHFRVNIKLASGGKLREVEQTLQNHLRRALTENLGIEKVGRIDINVTGFKSGKVSRSSVQPERAAPADIEEELAVEEALEAEFESPEVDETKPKEP
ncbi:MAG: alkaline shock response membrane anchor protein AmaP [Coraliomargarita sp.]|nr:alkaline shock response membrane anchor protein AmaP [Coraliomargarita sp.]